MEYRSLREWLQKVEKLGELLRLRGVHWNLEIGAARLMAERAENRSALLFDDIVDYPSGYRVLVNTLGSVKRVALTLGMPTNLAPVDLIQAWRERSRNQKPIPCTKVKSGALMENLHTGKDINIYEFPAPKWYELDGGRYIGTGSVTITRDPEEGWVNVGTYRVMIHDETTLGFYITPGKHGRIHRDKYFARGEACKVAISFGHNPLISLAGALELPYGQCEYDVVGGIRDEPVEVIEGEFTGLPIPADSEIAIEGESPLGEERMEGPYGEWTGYYGGSVGPEPVIRIKSIMHRDNPILMGQAPGIEFGHRHIMGPAVVWDQLEAAGVPDVRGVWFHGREHLFVVVSIKQRYAGHAKQAALITSQCGGAAYLGRYVIVVDEDIDHSDLKSVLWAITTRSDPERDIEILHRCWSSRLDTAIRPEEKRGLNSKAVIDATKPYDWIEDFPPSLTVSPELAQKVTAKWGRQLGFGV